MSESSHDASMTIIRQAEQIAALTEECDALLRRVEALEQPVDRDTQLRTERVKSRLLGMEDAISAFSDESLVAENKILICAIDEEMVSCHLGVFNPGDDPRKAINRLMCWAQGLGEYNALHPVDEADKAAWLKTPMLSSIAITHRSEQDANAILANRRARLAPVRKEPKL